MFEHQISGKKEKYTESVSDIHVIRYNIISRYIKFCMVKQYSNHTNASQHVDPIYSYFFHIFEFLRMICSVPIAAIMNIKGIKGALNRVSPCIAITIDKDPPIIIIRGRNSDFLYFFCLVIQVNIPYRKRIMIKI